MSVAPRLAATVVVLRPAPEGPPEILMVRRARGASFMADAYVFPGGRVDEADRAGADPRDDLRALRRAAARELREEASVEIDAASLVPFARWVTPSAEPKRFDASFFVAVVPAGTEARVDEAEVTERIWASAGSLLARQRRSELKLPPPTLRTLEELRPLADAEAVLAWARMRPLDPIQPKLVGDGESIVILLPWDEGYVAAAGEGDPIERTSALAGGTTRYLLCDGFFRAVGD